MDPLIFEDADGMTLTLNELVPSGRVSAICVRLDEGEPEWKPRRRMESPRALLDRVITEAKQADVWHVEVMAWLTATPAKPAPRSWWPSWS